MRFDTFIRNMSFKIESLSEEGAHDSTDTIIENLCLNNAKVYINNTDFLSIGSIKLSPLKVRYRFCNFYRPGP